MERAAPEGRTVSVPVKEWVNKDPRLLGRTWSLCPLGAPALRTQAEGVQRAGHWPVSLRAEEDLLPVRGWGLAVQDSAWKWGWVPRP